MCLFLFCAYVTDLRFSFIYLISRRKKRFCREQRLCVPTPSRAREGLTWGWGGVAARGGVWQHRRIRSKVIQHFPLILFHLRNLGECEKAAAQHSWGGVVSLQGLSNRIPSEGAIPRRLMGVARKQERLPPVWPRDCSAQALSRGSQCAVERCVGQRGTPGSQAHSLPLSSRSPFLLQHAVNPLHGDRWRVLPPLLVPPLPKARAPAELQSWSRRSSCRPTPLHPTPPKFTHPCLACLRISNRVRRSR